MNYMMNYAVANNETDTNYTLGLQDKRYPSSYQYNVLIMLAKRLIREQEAKESVIKNRMLLDQKLAMRIISD